MIGDEARVLLAVGLACCTVVACGDDTTDSDSGTSDTEVAYADVQAIWDGGGGGTGCHTVGGRAGGLVLALGDSHGNLVGVGAIGADMDLVTAGSLEESYLWHKLVDSQDSVGGAGVVMPMNGELSAADLSTIEQWIEEGAAGD